MGEAVAGWADFWAARVRMALSREASGMGPVSAGGHDHGLGYVRDRGLGVDGHAGAHALEAVDDDPVPRVEAVEDDALAVDGAAERDRAVRRDLVRADHEDEFLALVGLD